MGIDDTNPAPDVPSVSDVASAVVEKALEPAHLKHIEDLVANAIGRAEDDAVKLVWNTTGPAIRGFLKVLLHLLQSGEPALDDISKIAVDAVLGDGAKRGRVPDDVGKHILDKLAPAGGVVEPGLEGAARYLTTITHLQFETWLFGLISELVVDAADVVRGSGATLQSVAELREIVTQVFGGGRITRRVLSPFIDDGIVTPAKWATSKQYRPTLLSPADAIRQYLRGNWTRELMLEELARQGYSDGRIDALVNAQQKFLAPSDVRTLVDRQHWTQDHGLQHLRDQGYDEPTASDVLRLEGLHIFEAHEATEAGAIIAAYASHDIERADFVGLLATYEEVPHRRALYEELGELRRQLFVKHLSSAQAATCVRAGVLAFVDYRQALAREGYDDQAITALELLLRVEIDKAKSVDKHRQELETERAHEKALRDEAAAARKTEIERERALKRRGPLSDLERAAVRGLIPFARVEEVLVQEYDADTVALLVAGMEDDRQRYRAQQAAAEEARKRAARRNLDVGDLERAVLANLLTIEEFTRRLVQLKLDPSDAALLAAVLKARKADQDAARRKRDEAEIAAKRKRIDLGRFERLVRLGARPMTDYTALLAELGFDEPSRAAMVDLLNLEITQDRAADAKRAEAEAKLRAKGLSFDQFRRAVVLGLKTVDQFNTFLVQQGFTADAIATLVAEAQLAVADAEAARARRETVLRRAEEPTLALPVLARAASLGVLTPADYQARLAAAGFSEDDIAIDMELLAVEIADVQARRARRDELQASSGERGLSLAQLETAVKKGEASVEDYRARAASLNYSADDVALLVALLEDELAGAAAP